MTARVWVVDDEPLIRAAVVAVLTEVGYDATPLASAEELYVRLVEGETPPDLLVLDQMLPDESGDQIIRSLRERPQYRDIPVLFLTALSEDDAGRLTDLAPVVTKPFDFRDLVNTVAQLTGTPPQGMADEGPAA
jgi:DNA-binding response OmpR family regulator